jgi:hypothetical protein
LRAENRPREAGGIEYAFDTFKIGCLGDFVKGDGMRRSFNEGMSAHGMAWHGFVPRGGTYSIGIRECADVSGRPRSRQSHAPSQILSPTSRFTIRPSLADATWVSQR